MKKKRFATARFGRLCALSCALSCACMCASVFAFAAALGLFGSAAQAEATEPPTATPVKSESSAKAKPPGKAKAAEAKSADTKAAEAKPAKPTDNLLLNGHFESGKVTPAHWQTIDGLSTFWVKTTDPRRGRVLRFDTDVLQSQAYNWWVRIADGASPLKAPSKTPTTPPKYDTLAGLDGVWFWSDPVPIQKGKSYWLSLEAKGAGMLVWLVGYPEKPDTSFAADAGAVRQYLEKVKGTAAPNRRNRRAFVHKYVWKGQLKVEPSKDWRTFSRRKKPFRPTRYTPKVKYVRVLLYPFWPPGEYFVDNVRLEEFDPQRHGQP